MEVDGKNKVKEKSKLIHCSFCNGLLLKNINKLKMEGIISFLTICPHCKHKVAVLIENEKNEIFKIRDST